MSYFRHPLIFFLPFYLIGLLLGGTWPEERNYFLLFFLLSLLSLIVVKKVQHFSFLRYLLGISIIAGGALYQSYFFIPPKNPSHIVNYIDKKVNLKGKIISVTPFSDKAALILTNLQLLQGKQEGKIKGKIAITVYHPSKSYHKGNIIKVRGKVKTICSFGNPGIYDYARLWHGKGVWARMWLQDKNILILDYEKPGLWPYLLETIREKIRRFLAKHLSQPAQGVYQTLLLGEKASLLPFIKDDFIFTGTSHLLAISGLHLGMVMVLSFTLFWYLLSRSEYLLLKFELKKIAVLLSFIPTFFYASLAHFSPATARSFVMILLFWWLYFSRRLKDTWVFLATAAWLLLLLHPPMIYQISFQLSFLALASILYFTPRLPGGTYWLSLKSGSFKQKCIRYLLLSLYVSIGAWLGTLPIILHYFAGVSFIAPVVNLLAIPWMGFVILPLGLLSIFTLFFSPSLSAFFLHLGEETLNPLLCFLHKIATIPGIFTWCITPNWLEVLAIYIFLFAVFYPQKGKKYMFVALFCFFLLDISFQFYKHSQKNLTVSFLDVGGGTSVLLRFPHGKTMLIGGGGSHFSNYDPGRFVVAKTLWAQKLWRLDYLVLPTPHYSYLNGLPFIAQHFHPQFLWINGLKVNDAHYWHLFYLCQKRGIPIKTPKTQKIDGVKVKVLYPKKTEALFLKDSLILKCHYKEVSFLFPFYTQAKTLEKLSSFLKTDVLLSPNYGSKAVNSPHFVQKIKARYVVFAGRIPTREVVKNYVNSGSKVFFTGKDGMINFVTNGYDLKVKTHY